MKVGEIVFYSVIILIALHFIWNFLKVFFTQSQQEKDYEKKLKESLQDEFIIDPETGAKLTLEQAESGHWINHDNTYRESSENEIEQLPHELERQYIKCLNYLKRKEIYKIIKFDDDLIMILENTNILSKYSDWSYSASFELETNLGYVFIPTITISDSLPGYFESAIHETQIMFWLKLDNDFGHYYFRKKTKTEKILDKIRKDDDLHLSNYECFTLKRTNNYILLNKMIEKFEDQLDLEIEFVGHNLFIKNCKFINIDDIKRIESIVERFQ